MIQTANTERFCGPRIRESLWHNDILRIIVRATRAEHECVHAHAHVSPLGLDALPHEHAGAFDASDGAGFLTDFEILTALQLIHCRQRFARTRQVVGGCRR